MNFAIRKYISDKDTMEKIKIFVNGAENGIDKAIQDNRAVILAMRESYISYDLIRRIVYDNMFAFPERFARDLRNDFIHKYYEIHKEEIDNILEKLSETLPFSFKYSTQSCFENLKSEYLNHIAKGCELKEFTREIYFQLRVMINRKIDEL